MITDNLAPTRQLVGLTTDATPSTYWLVNGDNHERNIAAARRHGTRPAREPEPPTPPSTCSECHSGSTSGSCPQPHTPRSYRISPLCIQAAALAAREPEPAP